MISKQSALRASLSPQAAGALGGGSAGANVGIIETLPDNQKAVAREAFSSSLSTMWILYVAFSACGLLVSLAITRNVLGKEHEETKTGLDEEKRRRAEREQARADKKKKRMSQGDLISEVEGGLQAAEKKGSKCLRKLVNICIVHA